MMKMRIPFRLAVQFLPALWFWPLFAQNSAPVVTNVQLSQRPDCSFMVDITYDVNDADADTLNVTVLVSYDNGLIYYPAAVATLTGDYGPGVIPGQGKQVTWDFGTQHPGWPETPFMVKIIADDEQTNIPGQPCPGLPSFEYQGQVYNTVQIGLQCWMKENLNVGTMITSSSQTDNGVIEKFCYNNDAANCSTYGGLYQWKEMMQYSTVPGIQGICPDGWHLPSDEEFCVMVTFHDPDVNCVDFYSSGVTGSYAGGKLKETGFDHWFMPNIDATNEFGFMALGAGHKTSNYNFLKANAFFWTSTQHPTYPLSYAICWSLDYYYPNIYHYNMRSKSYAYSVRCIKD